MKDTRIKFTSSSYASVPSDEQLEITFQDLSYAVPTTKKAYKKVLDNITGRFRPGRLTIILGSSGAGKTSLLSLIAGEARKGIRSGELKINGASVDGTFIRKISGFVHQEDVIMDTQRVREAVEMSAKLRLPQGLSREERAARVDDVIGLMHLSKAQNTVIGNAMVKGVSGGEKKRTAIAMELVTNPKILFLDEPTSGLDTYSAYTTVRHLKTLAKTGRTIVATLHQPSSEIFHLIDDLVLMDSGGIIYCGAAAESIGYFARLGYQCPQYSNPADFFFMSVLHRKKPIQDGDGDGDEEGEDEDEVEGEQEEKALVRTATSQSISPGLLIEQWKRSHEAVVLATEMQKSHNDSGKSLPSSTVMASLFTQFLFLLGRAWNNAIRNKMVFKAKLAQVVIMAVLIDIIFWQIPNKNGNAQIQDRAGVLFFLIVNMIIAFGMGNLSVFSSEKIVFQREYNSRMYSLPSYFFSKIMVETPFLIITPMIYVVLMYFAVGLQLTVEKILICLITVVLLANSGAALGLWAAATFSTMTVALAVFPMLIMPLMMFAGLFVNLGDLPVWISWLQWLSPMKYCFVALMRNEFTGLEFGCGKGGSSGGQIGPNGTCIPRPGEDVLRQFAVDNQGSILVNVLALLGFTVGLTSLAYVALMRLTWVLKSRVKVVDRTTFDRLLGV